MPSHNAKKSGSIPKQNNSGIPKKKEIKPPNEGPKSVLDGHPTPVFRGFFPSTDESDVATEVAQEPPPSRTGTIIADAIARSLELAAMDKGDKGKVNVNSEKDSDFEMVRTNDAHNNDDDDESVVVVDKEAESQSTENEDDHVEV